MVAGRSKEKASMIAVKGSLKLMQKIGIKTIDYLALRKLPQAYKEKVFIKILKSLYNSKKLYIMDGHLLNLRGIKIVSVFSEDMLKYINLLVIIKVDSIISFSRLTKERQVKRGIFKEGLNESDKKRIWKNYINQANIFYNRLKPKYSDKLRTITNDNLDNSVRRLLKLAKNLKV